MNQFDNPHETKMARVRGLELLFNLVKGQLQSKFDCAVAAVHCLLTNEGLQCYGIGDTFSEDDKPSELLPPGWNSNQEVYTLRYKGKKPKGNYLLKAVKTGNLILHVNVVFEEDTAATITINVEKMVGDGLVDYETAYLDLGALVNDFQKEIIEKLFIEAAKPSASKSKSPDERPAKPSVPPIAGPNPRFQQDPLRVGPPSFPQVGGRDLDPFGQGQGGMFYDPLQQPNPRNPRIYDPSGFGVPPFGGPGGLPRGSVPPGARFDPFGPPGGPNRPGPNPDRFKPPDFDDFM